MMTPFPAPATSNPACGFPFFREHVHGLVAKMGLPAAVLPLFRLAAAPTILVIKFNICRLQWSPLI